ncbi:MAG: hypothetical protein Q7V63_00730 [Gammaproteobacteria bacterium]|nr:hypothetical protein [Gammaproteobacteria bacterium]
MKRTTLALLLMSLSMACHAWADNSTNQAIWLQEFSSIQPIDSATTQAYCDSHIPKSVKASIDQLTSDDGIVTANNITMRYSAYKGVGYDDVYFTFVTAKLKGQDSSGSWSDKMKLYEQSLSASGNTSGVWSTSKCRGTFAGQIVGQASS